MLSGHGTKTNKAASDVTVEAPVVMSFACIEWRSAALSPIRDLSGGINQMTVFEIIIAALRCLSDCMLAYYAVSCKCCCELGLSLVSSAHVTCVRYRTISGRRDNRKVADSAIDIA